MIAGKNIHAIICNSEMYTFCNLIYFKNSTPYDLKKLLQKIGNITYLKIISDAILAWPEKYKK